MIRAVVVPVVLGLALAMPATAVTAAQRPSIERGDWPLEAPPPPLPPRDSQFPPYQLRTLPNGLQVVAVLHHEQPVVSMRMIVRAGSALDPADKLGMARLAAALLTQGTAGRSASQLNDEVDFMGAAMGAGAGTDLSFLNMIVMKDSFETGLRMLSDMARRPAFAEAEIERQRQQMLSGLQVSFDDPEFVADAVFDRLVYGFHPYGLPRSGTAATLAAISRADLVAFHGAYFTPNNTILAIVGDVTAEEAFSGVAKAFGDWERRETPAAQFLAPPDPTRRIIVVDKPEAVQTEIRAGHVGIRRNHPDYMAVSLAIRILGGEGANRLHQVLRTARGLTYGAQAEMEALQESGSFAASTNTRSEATGEVLRLMVDEFWRLQRERVRERELADAKAYITGSFPLTIETPDAIATQVLNVLFYGLPIEELQTYRERVNAVTVDDIARVARLYLRPDRLSIVLVGQSASFLSQLPGIGFSGAEVVSASALDLTTADFKTRGGRPSGVAVPSRPGARPAPPSYQTGAAPRPPARSAPRDARALLDRVIAAKGGLDALRAVKTIVAVTESETPTRDGRTTVKSTTYLAYPDRVRVETQLPGSMVVQAFDGEGGWIEDPRGVRDVPERAVDELRASLRRDTIALLLAAHEGRVRVRTLPDVKLPTLPGDEGLRYRALEISDVRLEPTVLYIHPDSALIVKQGYVLGGIGSPLVEETFGDYRAVDGVQIAFRATIHRGGVLMVERQIRAIRLNQPIESARFRRPST
jgi:zinc protease